LFLAGCSVPEKITEKKEKDCCIKHL